MFARIILAVVVVGALCTRAGAQGVDGDTTEPQFPETASLRDHIAALESSRIELGAAVDAGDSLLTLLDSIQTLPHPWEAAPTLRSWVNRFPQSTDSTLAAWLSPAETLRDSAAVLRNLDAQRSAMHVDSIRGIVDLIPFNGQKIYRVRATDSTVRVIQLEKLHKLGDTIVTFGARFGRWMFPAPLPSAGWEMTEGAPPAGSADSIFEVVRETTKPRAYDAYDRFAARFEALRIPMESQLATTLTQLREGMRRDIDVLTARIATIDRELRDGRRDLALKNLLYASRGATARGDRISAVTLLERLVGESPNFPGAAEELTFARHATDSTAKTELFGADGRIAMELVPSGEVLLRSGERFRPEPFFIDRAPINAHAYAEFEAATGYHSKGRWRAMVYDSAMREPVRGLAAEDKAAFARWAGKRAATPQEIEYVFASGFESLARRMKRPGTENLYHVVEDADGFYCVVDLNGLEEMKRDDLLRNARVREKEIRTMIEKVGSEK